MYYRTSLLDDSPLKEDMLPKPKAKETSEKKGKSGKLHNRKCSKFRVGLMARPNYSENILIKYRFSW